jgi:hypothetical protein
MASTADLQIVQGSDFNISLIVYDDFGAVVNLTGYIVRGLVKNRYGDASSLFDMAPTITNAAGGEVSISLNPSSTKDFPVGQFHYGIEVEKGDIAFKALNGNVLVLPEVNS